MIQLAALSDNPRLLQAIQSRRVYDRTVRDNLINHMRVDKHANERVKATVL